MFLDWDSEGDEGDGSALRIWPFCSLLRHMSVCAFLLAGMYEGAGWAMPRYFTLYFFSQKNGGTIIDITVPTFFAVVKMTFIYFFLSTSLSRYFSKQRTFLLACDRRHWPVQVSSSRLIDFLQILWQFCSSMVENLESEMNAIKE